MNTFDDVWLSRSPRPEYICFDNGVEYKFGELANNHGIDKKNSTPFYPQSNGIIESVHSMLNHASMPAEVDGRELDEICNTKYLSYHSDSNTMVIGVGKRHGNNDLHLC
jgi:hypothetical protein